jgi:hypothetical protein
MRRLLIIGCGDIALRMVPLVRTRYRVCALVRNRERFSRLRALRLRPVVGDRDKVETLHVLSGLAHDVVHFAPPPPSGPHDTRTAHPIAALTKGKSLPQQLLYISTSGVHGDCGGALRVELRHPSVHDGIAAARMAIAGRAHDGSR